MTKKNVPTLAEQRQLLNLRADSLRLKIMAAQLKSRHQSVALSRYGRSLLTVLEILPLSGLALKLSSKPKRWRNKFLVAGVLVGISYLTQKFKSSATAAIHD